MCCYMIILFVADIDDKIKALQEQLKQKQDEAKLKASKKYNPQLRQDPHVDVRPLIVPLY